MTKSPVRLAKKALGVAQEALPSYSNRYSRRDFTQHQLFAILVLRQFLKTDYRGIVQMLEDFSDLRKALKLKKIPHYSTLCYAEKRLLKKGLSSACRPRSSGEHELWAWSRSVPREPLTPRGWRADTPAPTTWTARATSGSVAAAGRS